MSDKILHQQDTVDFEQFFETLPNAFIVMRADDPTFEVVYENQAHAKISLAKQAEVIGKPVLEAFPDNSEKYKQSGISDLIESFRKVIKTGKPDVMSLLNYDVKDHQGYFVEKWWRVTHYPLMNKAGEVAFVYQATEDVSSQVTTTSQLSKTQGQLDSALAIGLVSTWYWDIENDIVLGDKNLAKQFGVSADKAASGLPLKRFIDSIHPDDRPRVAAAIEKSISHKLDYEEEYRTIDFKGRVRWVIARGKVETDALGNASHLLGVLVDITDRKEAESKLEQVRAMFAALFESKIVSIAMADLEGHVLQANQKFLRTFGYTNRDLQKGITSKALTPQQSKSKTVDIYESLRKTGELEPTEKDYLRKDGTLVPMLVGGAMLKGTDNLFVAFMLDISETKELKALNVAKDEFIALASHQLRTPATAVKQYLGIIIDEFAGPINADQLQYLNVAFNSNERQLTIINDLLKTAQIDTKGYQLQLAEHDLNEIVDDVIAQFKPTCDARKQPLIFERNVRKALAMLDRNEISLALVNLVENASKYTPHGKKITIRTTRNRQFIGVSIADEGVGIAKKDQEAIFEKFTRINNPLSDTVNGTGLGLYWVKRIVELHGGRLLVDSTLHKGTTFTMLVPS